MQAKLPFYALLILAILKRVRTNHIDEQGKLFIKARFNIEIFSDCA